MQIHSRFFENCRGKRFQEDSFEIICNSKSFCEEDLFPHCSEGSEEGIT